MADPLETRSDEVETTEKRDPSQENQYRRAIFNVPVTVTVSLGRSRLSVREVLDLRPESIVPLSARINDPIDLMIDNKVIARADLVELEDGLLGVKITEISEEIIDVEK